MPLFQERLSELTPCAAAGVMPCLFTASPRSLAHDLPADPGRTLRPGACLPSARKQALLSSEALDAHDKMKLRGKDQSSSRRPSLFESKLNAWKTLQLLQTLRCLFSILCAKPPRLGPPLSPISSRLCANYDGGRGQPLPLHPPPGPASGALTPAHCSSAIDKYLSRAAIPLSISSRVTISGGAITKWLTHA